MTDPDPVADSVPVVIICAGDFDGYSPLPLPMPPEMVRRITCSCCKRRRMIAYHDSLEGSQCGECYTGDCAWGTCAKKRGGLDDPRTTAGL